MYHRFQLIIFSIATCLAEDRIFFPTDPSSIRSSINREKSMLVSDASPRGSPHGHPREFVVREKPACVETNDVITLCDVDDEYDDLIALKFEEAINNTNLVGEIGALFTELLIEDELNLVDPVPPDVRVRFGDGLIAEDPACISKEKIIYPKRGMTKSENWVFLLNQGDGGYEQGIRVEECISEGSKCSIGDQTGIESVCRQKYIYKKMLALDQAGTRVAPESIFVPSCCSCYIKSVFTRAARPRTFSVNSPPSQPPSLDMTLAFPPSDSSSSESDSSELDTEEDLLSGL